MDENSSLSSSASDPEPPTPNPKTPPQSPAVKEARRRKKLADQQERVKSAKTMDLSYFLEMVDVKHRYGSNLRKYHAEWRTRPTHENFFYWLDHGEGSKLDLPNCTRQRLDSMQVRYLSKEERRLYEVDVGEKGKLVWRKDSVRVDTTPGKWKDSVIGIVSVDSRERAWAHNRPMFARGSSESSGFGSDLEASVTGATTSASAQGEKTSQSESPGSPTTEKSKRRPLSSLFRKISSNKKPESASAEKGEEKEKEKKKAPKQIWIFVSI